MRWLPCSWRAWRAGRVGGGVGGRIRGRRAPGAPAVDVRARWDARRRRHPGKGPDGAVNRYRMFVRAAFPRATSERRLRDSAGDRPPARAISPEYDVPTTPDGCWRPISPRPRSRSSPRGSTTRSRRSSAASPSRARWCSPRPTPTGDPSSRTVLLKSVDARRLRLLLQPAVAQGSRPRGEPAGVAAVPVAPDDASGDRRGRRRAGAARRGGGVLLLAPVRLAPRRVGERAVERDRLARGAQGEVRRAGGGLPRHGARRRRAAARRVGRLPRATAHGRVLAGPPVAPARPAALRARRRRPARGSTTRPPGGSSGSRRRPRIPPRTRRIGAT